MGVRSFTPADQADFARLSGDYNPIHVDPVAARRLLFGAPIVHGVHGLLWALDDCLSHQSEGCLRLASLEAEFLAPLIVGSEMTVQSQPCADGNVTIGIFGADQHCMEIRACMVPDGRSAVTQYENGAAWLETAPASPPASSLQGAKGPMSLALSPDLLARLVPRVAASLPPAEIALLLAASRLVGMVCPGMHSLLAGLTLQGSLDTPQAEARYEVTRYDPRFRMASIRVWGGGLSGSLRAFQRPGPTDQPPFEHVSTRVAPNAFSGRRAVIVGGSRGLGELSAKLLVAGGSEVLFTYHRGTSDAQRLLDELRVARPAARVDALALNVLDPCQATIEALRAFHPTDLLYCATPPIFGRAAGYRPADRLHAFESFYVAAFDTLVRALAPLGPLHVLYPSSEALESPRADMVEYIEAKRAGEARARELMQVFPSLTVTCPRLPRVATDQTSTLARWTPTDPVPILLKAMGT